MRPRVLLISCFFPPTGGAGVQRALKFVKYLPQHGWDVSVLTVSNPSVPVRDPELLREIPEETVIRRARTLEPGYGLKQAISAGDERRTQPSLLKRIVARLVAPVRSCLRSCATAMLQPDPQILWYPGAVHEGRRLLRDIAHDVILVTGPPFSSFLIGAKLASFSGLPLVLDYRDEWDISNACWENRRVGNTSLAIQKRMQQGVIRHASRLIATTRASSAALSQVCCEAESRALVSTIYNGYDAAEIPPYSEPPRGERFRLSYVGTLWNLTDVTPLVEAVRLLSAESPELASKLELVFAGRRTAAQDEQLDRLEGLPVRVVRRPYVDHAEAIELMRSSHALCLLLGNQKEAGRVVPAKLFEYAAIRRRLLTIAPQGEVWELLAHHPACSLHPPSDVRGIADSLRESIEQHLAGNSDDLSGFDASRFERSIQAGELAELLNDVTERAVDSLPSKDQFDAIGRERTMPILGEELQEPSATSSASRHVSVRQGGHS